MHTAEHSGIAKMDQGQRPTGEGTDWKKKEQTLDALESKKENRWDAQRQKEEGFFKD